MPWPDPAAQIIAALRHVMLIRLIIGASALSATLLILLGRLPSW